MKQGKEKNQLSTRHKIFLIFVIVVVFVTGVQAIIQYQKELKIRKFIANLNEPKKITLIYGKQKEVVTDRSAEKILKEIQQKHIGYMNTHSLESHSVHLTIEFEDDKSFICRIVPDAYKAAIFWVFMDNDLFDGQVKRIRSFWLMIFFKEIVFFDHNKILER